MLIVTSKDVHYTAATLLMSIAVTSNDINYDVGYSMLIQTSQMSVSTCRVSNTEAQVYSVNTIVNIVLPRVLLA